MATEDQDILEQIAELRRQKAAEIQAMQSDNNPLGLIVSGALGGLADVTAAGGGLTGGYTDKALSAFQTGAKGQRDMRLKALEGTGEEIKALNALAQSRASDRKTAGLYEQQAKLLSQAEEGRDKRAREALESQERREAGKLAAKAAPKGMKYVLDPETGEKSLVEVEGSYKPSQYQAATYGTRAEQAEKVMDDLVSKGYDPTSASGGLQSWLSKGMTSGLASSEAQQLEQAQRNFVNAILRRESGAAIAPSEFSSAQAQYFPQYGDSPEKLAQKAANRQAVTAGLLAEAGPAYGEVQKKFAGLPKTPVAPAKGGAGGGLIPEAQAGAGAPDPVIDGYAKQHGLDYRKAESILKGRGYGR